MADKTGIEWTDATWNPTTGCDRVSPGCAHCYALDLAARLKAMGSPRYQRDGDPRTSGPGFGLTLHPDKLDEPLRWRRPRMVFVNSMSDLFHEGIPARFLAEVFAVMTLAPQHTFQILTKRPERARELLADAMWWACVEGAAQRRIFETTGEDTSYTLAVHGPLPNVWVGVSIENSRYTWRADVLREIPAAVRFISAEPLLGSLFDSGPGEAGRDNARRHVRQKRPTGVGPVAGDGGCVGGVAGARRPLDLTGIDWLIVGGESGGRFARPMHPAWARELRDACGAGNPRTFDYLGPDPNDPVAGEAWGYRPAFFFKQWGSWSPSGVGDVMNTRTHTSVKPDGRTIAPGFAEEGDAFVSYRGPTPKAGGRHLDGRTWDEMPDRARVPA